MTKLVPALVCSVAAHAGLLTVLALPLGDSEGSLDVFEVAALLRPRPVEPRPEPPTAAPVPAPEPEVPRRRARRRQPPREASPEPQPTPMTAPAPPQAAPAAEASPLSSAAQGGPAPTTEAPAAVAARTSGAPSGTTGAVRARAARRRGGASGPDPCDAAARAVSAGLRATAYPSWVRDLGLAGTVRINLRVGRDGRPRGIRVASSSGHAALDRHTMSAVRRLHDLPRCTRPITVPVSYRVARR